MIDAYFIDPGCRSIRRLVTPVVLDRSTMSPTDWLMDMSRRLEGDVLWVWYEVIGRDSFPSMADVLYLPGTR